MGGRNQRDLLCIQYRQWPDISYPPDNLSEENTGSSFFPQISSSGNNVYVVWEDDTPGNFDIFFAVSTDNGQTFSDS